MEPSSPQQNKAEMNLKVAKDIRDQYGIDPEAFTDEKIEYLIKLLMTYRWSAPRQP